jgi:hypothetical protein
MRSLSRVALLVLCLCFAGCASEQPAGYSGSELDTGTAVHRSSNILVGKILTLERGDLPGNTFFAKIVANVRVLQTIRGTSPDAVTVGYLLEGGSESPFRVGENCVFCIFNKSLANPGEYTAGKILPATPENIATVRNEAAR